MSSGTPSGSQGRPEPAEHRSYRPLITGRRGAVASNHPLATLAGLEVLQRGGTAFDAGVAVAVTLGVVEPFMSGLGGDGFYHAFRRASGEAIVFNGTGPAPRAATSERFAAGLPLSGPRSFTTPGSVGGLGALHAWGGRLPWQSLFDAAIYHAREGFGATPTYRRYAADGLDVLRADPRSAATFLRDGVPPEVGSPIRQPALARTLEEVAAEGADAFYRGGLGARLAAALRDAGALVDAADLAAFRPDAQAPIESTYRGYTIREAPPNSVGWVLLAELAIVEHFDLHGLGALSADAIHLLVEAKRFAFADREEHAGDPRVAPIPVERLISRELAAHRAGLIDRDRAASRPIAPGVPRQPGVAGRPGVTAADSGNTTYFCVVDGEGNALSGIQSINGTFGSGVTAGDTGILLNNRITPFHVEQGHPNQVAPGKRVRHTMNPPMVFRDGELVGVFGTPGGDAQVQVNLQVLTLMLDFGWDPQQAAEAARWASTEPGQPADFPHEAPYALEMESRFEPGVLRELGRRGHPVVEIGPLDGPCSVEIIWRDPGTGMLLAGSDPRRDGWALAW